jgi:hypothetical protein
VRVVAGALEGDSVLKFRAIRCDFAMNASGEIRGEDLVCSFGEEGQPEFEVVGSKGKLEVGHPRVAFEAGGEVARW